MTFKNKLMGVLTLLIGLLFLYATRYLVAAWVDILPDTYTDTVFWAGYIGILFMCILVKPVLLILTEEDGSVLGAATGVLGFLTGLVLMLILWHIYDVLIPLLSTMITDYALDAFVVQLFWFAYIVVTILGVIVIPMWAVVEEPIKIEGINANTGNE